MTFRQNLNLKRTLLYILFLVNLGIIFYFWWLGSGSLFSTGHAGIYIAIGRILGLLAEYLILVQLVLIGRIRPVEKLYGFDVLAGIHKQLGKIIATILFFHPIFLTLGYSELNSVSLWQQFLQFLTSWDDVFKAFLGFCLLFIIIGFSVVIVRRRLKYETWHGIHLSIYIAIFLFFSHQINTADVSVGSGLYYWLTLNFLIFGLFLLYRFIRPLYISLYKYQFKVERVIQETHDICSVYIGGKNIENFVYDAGQFAHVLFWAQGFRQPHPFSFSYGPGKKQIRFSIKASGDFTEKIPKLPIGTKVIIDGPLGVFTKQFAYSEKILLIAGGIGITPLRAMAESLQEEKRAVSLIYGVRTSDDVAFNEELQKLAIPYKVFYSQGKDMPPEMQGIITVEKIAETIPDYKERDIYICGPTIMLRNLVQGLEVAGVPKKHIHYEIFAL